MLKLAIGIFYSFVVFFFICNIVLAELCSRRSGKPSLRWMTAYLINFFIYGVSNLLIYYRIHILVINDILKVLSTIRSVSFLFIFILWMEYLISLCSLPDKRRKWQYISFMAAGAACLVLWIADSLFFVTNEYNVVNFAGNITGNVMEIVLGVFFLAAVVFYLKNTEHTLADVLNSVVQIIFLCFVTVQDFNISFAEFNVQAQASAMWLICPFFCAAVNGIIFVYLFSSVDRMLHDPWSDGSEASGPISVDEMQRRYDISQREKDVIVLMCMGKTNQEIASELNISENTVKKHAGNIYRKTGTDSRHDLIKKINQG